LNCRYSPARDFDRQLNHLISADTVAFLTENVTALQLEQLAAVMDERKCEHMEMF